MYSTEHYSNGDGYLGNYTRQMSPTRPPPLPYYRSYHNAPRREENWSRSEHMPPSRPIYSGSSQGHPSISRPPVIPQRFEHRMDHQEAMDRPPVPTWRGPPQHERSVTLQESEPRERVVYRPKHPGLKTSDLSHRLGIPNRNCKKPLMSKESSPRSVHVVATSHNDRKVSAKDRLTLPARVDKRQEQTVNKKTNNSPVKPVKRLASHVRSATQNDPRLKSDSGDNTPPPKELKRAPTARRSISQFLGRVRECIDPGVQFFDEECTQKEDTTRHNYQDNFDVPLPPSVHENNCPTANHGEHNTSKSVENTKDSFWDETDDVPTESLPVLFTDDTPNVPASLPQGDPVVTPSDPHNTSLPVHNNNNNNKAPFFDEEFVQTTTTTTTTTATTTNNPQTNVIVKKNNHHHNKNMIKHKKRNESKSRRHSRPNEAVRHSKHLHKPSHPHSPSKPPNKYNHKSPSGLLADSNSPLLTMKARTHIRLKKTVNLADHEPAHSSTEEEDLVLIPPKLDIPLPSAPLPLSLNSSPEHIATCVDLPNEFPGDLDFNPIESDDMCAPSSQTRDDTDIGLAVEVSQTGTNDTHTITQHKKRQLTASDAEDIAIQIEYISDDVIHKSPRTNRTKPVIISPPILIEEFKPNSPKCDSGTPDSVFTPSVSPCVVSSADSPIISIDFSENSCAKRLKFTGKDKLDLTCITRKSYRKPDHSFSNTREVCIPLTKLDVTQYGGKVKSASEPPLDKLPAKERQMIKVFSQWKCMFCHKGANESNLGYLFGPYFKTGENLKLTPLPVSARRKASREFDENELWVHAPCALWTPGVLMVSFHLSGLIEAYDGSLSNTCTECGNNGATLTCESEDCNNSYHYTCAESIHCSLNHESFKIHCPVHNQIINET